MPGPAPRSRTEVGAQSGRATPVCRNTSPRRRTSPARGSPGRRRRRPCVRCARVAESTERMPPRVTGRALDSRSAARASSIPACSACGSVTVGSSHGREVRGQAGAHPRRREQALDRVGDREAAPRGGRRARVYVPGRADREGRPRARRDRRREARDRVRRPLRRGRRARLRRDRRGVRRRARHARPLGRLRRSRGPRRALHRHTARPLLDGGRHLARTRSSHARRQRSRSCRPAAAARS